MFKYVSAFLIAAIFTGFLALTPSWAESEFPASIKLGSKALVLNGTGTRKATIFRVKVYRAALYLEEKSSDADAIINSSGAKRIVMRFVRDVSASKLRGAWEDGLENNVENYQSLSEYLKRFNSWMVDVEDGKEMILDFEGHTITVSYADKVLGKIDSAEFAQGLLSIWLGKSPPNKELKSGMLGKE